jgi:hypothetical protein
MAALAIGRCSHSVLASCCLSLLQPGQYPSGGLHKRSPRVTRRSDASTRTTPRHMCIQHLRRPNRRENGSGGRSRRKKGKRSRNYASPTTLISGQLIAVDCAYCPRKLHSVHPSHLRQPHSQHWNRAHRRS